MKSDGMSGGSAYIVHIGQGGFELDFAGIIVQGVEDDYFVAVQLVEEVTKLGGEALGPAPSVRVARLLISGGDVPDCAILDVRVADGLIYPLVQQLEGQGCRFCH